MVAGVARPCWSAKESFFEGVDFSVLGGVGPSQTPGPQQPALRCSRDLDGSSRCEADW